MLVGCSSVVTRLGPDGRAELYPATRLTMDATGDAYCWMFFACPILLVSLPVDIALDTVLLPIDGIRVLNRNKPKKGTAQTETETASS
ncbi:YceK/YidQ family lipoprotein [Pseudomonas sp. MM211]|nr:YceK/YidQ family lipoprotein [Pseudomonas sp. MM211]